MEGEDRELKSAIETFSKEIKDEFRSFEASLFRRRKQCLDHIKSALAGGEKKPAAGKEPVSKHARLLRDI